MHPYVVHFHNMAHFGLLTCRVLFVSQIKVSNSALVSAFMKELEPESPVTQVNIYLFFCKNSCMAFPPLFSLNLFELQY